MIILEITRVEVYMKYDYLIVGAGLYGAVFAREATDEGKKVLVIDRRKSIIKKFGNMLIVLLFLIDLQIHR